MSITKRKPYNNYKEIEQIVITINNPMTQIKTAESRRAKYYKIGDIIPAKYSKYSYQEFKTIKGKTKFLVNNEGERVIKNPGVAGQPRYLVVGGNIIFSQTLHHQVRSKMVEEYHTYFGKYLKGLSNLSKTLLEGEFLKSKLVIYDVLPEKLFWDCDNKWIFVKMWSDTLTERKKWTDDSIKYVRSNGEVEYMEIKDVKDKKFEFVISKIKLNG